MRANYNYQGAISSVYVATGVRIGKSNVDVDRAIPKIMQRV